MGTAMPLFDLLPPDEVSSLVEYVKYLSFRGQTELELINAMESIGASEWKDLAKQAGVWSDIATKAGIKTEADEEKLEDARVMELVLGKEKLVDVERAFMSSQVMGDDKALASVVAKWKEALKRSFNRSSTRNSRPTSWLLRSPRGVSCSTAKMPTA